MKLKNFFFGLLNIKFSCYKKEFSYNEIKINDIQQNSCNCKNNFHNISSQILKIENINSIYIREIKLKTINICNLTFQQDFKIILPKKLFISRKYTIIEFKYHLIKIFKFHKHLDPQKLRLWVLDKEIPLDELEKELINHLTNNNYIPNNDFIFPGILLDLFKNSTTFFELDAFLNDQIIIIEYVDNKIYQKFLFAEKNRKNLYFNEILKSIKFNDENFAKLSNALNFNISYLKNKNQIELYNYDYNIFFEFSDKMKKVQIINGNIFNNSFIFEEKLTNLYEEQKESINNKFTLSKYFENKYALEETHFEKITKFFICNNVIDYKIKISLIFTNIFEDYFNEFNYFSFKNFDICFNDHLSNRLKNQYFNKNGEIIYRNFDESSFIGDIDFFRRYILNENYYLENKILKELLFIRNNLYFLIDKEEIDNFIRKNFLTKDYSDDSNINEYYDYYFLKKFRNLKNKKNEFIKKKKEKFSNNINIKSENNIVIKKEKMTYYNPNLKSNRNYCHISKFSNFNGKNFKKKSK